MGAFGIICSTYNVGIMDLHLSFCVPFLLDCQFAVVYDGFPTFVMEIVHNSWIDCRGSSCNILPFVMHSLNIV